MYIFLMFFFMRGLVPHKEKLTECYKCIEFNFKLDNIKMCGIFKIILDILYFLFYVVNVLMMYRLYIIESEVYVKAKKIDLLRLCIVQFDIKPICEKFEMSELDCYHVLSTRYLNKFTRSQILQFAESSDFYNTPLALDLFELGANPDNHFHPLFYKYLSNYYQRFNLKMLRDCFKEVK